MKGKVAHEASDGEIFDILVATKRQAPTGGVTKPIVRATTVTRPKCKGSKPHIFNSLLSEFSKNR